MSIGVVPVKQGYVDLPEGQIHYLTAGDGPPLLLLHLTNFSSDLFADVIPILATRHRVIAMDRAGHGTSDPPPEGLRVEDLARTVADFLDALGVEPTLILGQHTGTLEAVEIAIAQPQRVKKLVLVACPDYSEEFRAKGLSNVRRMEPRMDGSHIVDLWRQRQEWASPATSTEAMHRVGMAALQCMSSSPTILLAVLRHYITERLPLVQVPTLFLAAEHDPMRVFLEGHRALLPASTPSEAVVIKDAGAFAAIEKPEEFAQIVMDYLAS